MWLGAKLEDNISGLDVRLYIECVRNGRRKEKSLTDLLISLAGENDLVAIGHSLLDDDL